MAHLDGSHVVIAETESGNVAVTGDLAGQCGVFYATATDGSVVVGSHAWRVAGEIGQRIDRRWLAVRLLVPGAVDVWQQGTPWEGVSALRPGWVLRVTRAGSLRPEPLVSLPAATSTLDEAGEALRQALDRATGHRVRNAVHPTCDLSGGLDSATVCALGSRHASLEALTVRSPGVFDTDYAETLADQLDGLRHEVMDEPPDVLPYSGLERLPPLDEPATCLADLATPSTLGNLWRHARGWARLRHLAPATLISVANSLRRTSYPDALRAEATRLAAGAEAPTGWASLVSWLGPGGTMPWATGDARMLVAEALREHADLHTAPLAPGGFGVGDTVAWMALTAFARAQRIYTDLAADHGVNHHAPFLDNGVVRACWSVPASIRTTPQQAKPLLSIAVRGLVPDLVLDRRDKGDYTSLHYRGLRHNADIIDDLLGSARLADLGLLDTTAVRDELHRGVAGLPIALGAFDTMLATELWLRTLHDPTPEPEANDRVSAIAA